MMPLSGIRILDLSRVFAAPWATQMLGDLGAEVIKIEHPTRGDDFRTYGPPFLVDENGQNTRESGYYLSANRNKKSVAIDISTQDGQQVLKKLAETADVFIENFKVGALAKYGLDYNSVREINPNIVYCSVTGFGQDGPWAQRGGLDSLIQALSGLMSLTGEPDRDPQKVGMIVDDFATGMYAVVAILAAMRHRDSNAGGGQYIDLALLDCGIAMLGPRVMCHLISGEEPERNGNASFGSAPAQTFPCCDGVVMIQAGSDDQFRRLCSVLGCPDMIADPRYKTRAERVVHIEALIPDLSRKTAKMTMKQCIATLEAGGVMCAPVNSVSQALANEQVLHRQMVQTISHPIVGELPIIRNPIRFSKTKIEHFSAPPMIGEHTEEVLAALNLMPSRRA